MKLTLEQQKKGQEVYRELVQKAWEDANFKNQLVNDPNSTISKYLGREVSEKIVVHDQTDANVIYINIPAEPNLNELELSDEQLEMVSGGEFVTAGLALACVGLFASGLGIGLAVSAMKD
jgi:hypothetical protein